MKTFTMLEVATEVAWQVGDTLMGVPRAESRWHVCDLAQRIINEGILDENSEDIDEIIGTWLLQNGEI